ncbi:MULTISPECIES: aldo/keto reductase [unclassified Caballeronia]|uniref:aldo/keto reductase n=1 Tax=unclassified Caballeronia TaxID=2646786 RepID=UPI002855D653|nr:MULTISPECIES: aldo/keto reductase [unclassified Caballeronia]MDR5822223.1 aldo/keto reductase [Caballeronia sp. LZ043]MDR5880379.1 aldo/keto reductase [Caballeronia sp. LZ032]
MSPDEIATAWVMAKGVLPIIGPRSVEQLRMNLAAADIALSAEDVAHLDAVSQPPPIFPHSMLHTEEYRQRITGGKLDDFVRPDKPVAWPCPGSKPAYSHSNDR